MFTSWSFSWKCITLLSLTSVLATATKLGLLVSLGILLQWHMPWWTPSRSAGNVDGIDVQLNSIFFSTDGKVLCDLIAIYSHSCNECDPNMGRLRVMLYGQKTSDLNTCQSGILDHKNDFDFNEGRKVFDGQNQLGSCYEVTKYFRIIFKASQAPLNAQLEGGFVFWEGPGTWVPHARKGVCVSWRHIQSLAVACDVVPDGEPHFPQIWKLVDCGQLSDHRFSPILKKFSKI